MHKYPHGDLPSAVREATKLEREARVARDSVAAMESSVTELRSQYVEALSNPSEALAAGSVLLTQLRAVQSAYERAAKSMAAAEAKVYELVM